MQVKKIIMAADHAGCPLKTELMTYLEEKGVSVFNYGVNDPAVSVDYPDKAYFLAKGIYNHEAEFGILVCGSGIGMSIAVNRYPFIRGALCYTPEMAELARKHNNANVLVLGGRLIDLETAKKIVDAFFTTEFEGGRHAARVNRLDHMVMDF